MKFNVAILSIRTQKWKVAESSATRARRAACCFCFPCMFLNLGLFLRNWVFTRQVLPRVAPKKLDLVDRLVCFLDFKILARQEERWSSNSGSRVPLQLLPCSEYEDNTCSIGATSAYWHPLVPTAIRLLLRSSPLVASSFAVSTRNDPFHPVPYSEHLSEHKASSILLAPSCRLIPLSPRSTNIVIYRVPLGNFNTLRSSPAVSGRGLPRRCVVSTLRSTEPGTARFQ